MSNELRAILQDTLESCTPSNIDRTPVVDYLFRWRFGDRLPRGKQFDQIRMVERQKDFFKLIDDLSYHDGLSQHIRNVSPYLIMQRALLTLAQMKKLCCYNIPAIADVISNLEGSKSAPTTDLIKSEVSFSNSGVLPGYKHHHVPLLPNAYLGMYGKKDRNGNLINLDRILSGIDAGTGSINLTEVEQKIASIGKSKGGRMTGHWLISKKILGQTYYLGVFPHGHRNYDDWWIKQQLIESERLLMRRGL